MEQEIKALKEEISALKEEVQILKNALGVQDHNSEGPPDIIVNSLRVVKNDNVLVYIGDYGNKGKSGVIQLSCANGNRIQIQGLYYDKAIRMYSNNSKELLFSIGGDTNSGNLTVYNTLSGAKAVLRTSQQSGIVETQDKDGDLSMRMT